MKSHLFKKRPEEAHRSQNQSSRPIPAEWDSPDDDDSSTSDSSTSDYEELDKGWEEILENWLQELQAFNGRLRKKYDSRHWPIAEYEQMISEVEPTLNFCKQKRLEISSLPWKKFPELNRQILYLNETLNNLGRRIKQAQLRMTHTFKGRPYDELPHVSGVPYAGATTFVDENGRDPNYPQLPKGSAHWTADKKHEEYKHIVLGNLSRAYSKSPSSSDSDSESESKPDHSFFHQYNDKESSFTHQWHE